MKTTEERVQIEAHEERIRYEQELLRLGVPWLECETNEAALLKAGEKNPQIVDDRKIFLLTLLSEHSSNTDDPAILLARQNITRLLGQVYKYRFDKKKPPKEGGRNRNRRIERDRVPHRVHL